jgi:hypothetical protein
MANETPQSGPPLREAAAAAVAPDPATASLLAKHSAGEPLTQAEYGKVGALYAKAKRMVFGNRGAAPGSGRPGAPTGNAAAVGSVASDQAPAGGMAPVPVDAGLAVRTTAAVLRRCNAITVRWIEGEARRAGAQGQTLDRFRAAAALQADDQQLIAELSPDILAEMGIDVRKFPIVTAAAVLGLHGTTLWLAVDELREMRKERDKEFADRALREDREAREARAKTQLAQVSTGSTLLDTLAAVQQQPTPASQPAAIPAERPWPPGAPPKVT